MNNTKKDLKDYKKIALIGMMGSGKTSSAKAFIELIKTEQNDKILEPNLIDLDLEFEKKHNILIKDYFKKYGETQFRKEEELLLKNFSKKQEFIMSCGGGIIISKENRELLFNKDILTVYLEASVDEIYDRIKNDTSRPLLLVKNPKEEIGKILNSRITYYKMAHLTIDTNNKTPKQTALELFYKIYGNKK